MIISLKFCENHVIKTKTYEVNSTSLIVVKRNRQKQKNWKQLIYPAEDHLVDGYISMMKYDAAIKNYNEDCITRENLCC